MTAIPRLFSLMTLVATVAALAACGAPVPPSIDKETSEESIVTYTYDVEAKNWVSDVNSVAPAAGNNNVLLTGNNTVIIQLQPDSPIQEIIIDEGLIIGGGDPIFDIDGNPSDNGSGTLRIGTLTMTTVDARRLEIRDTQVVSSNITNVVAQDDEFTLNTTNVTEVFVERGASSTLSLTSFRVDRIRILGVSDGSDTHLERLTVTRSGFVGKIRIEDAKIASLILTSVSLEDP
ncbi:MAG: hypothetical protein HYX80_01595 [Chloroflexi bacterium]|nr:hypothetical protein [Chloroflexota bacterium]